MRANIEKFSCSLFLISLLFAPSFQLVARDRAPASQLNALDTANGFTAVFRNVTDVGYNDLVSAVIPLSVTPTGGWIGKFYIEDQQFNVLYDLGSSAVYVPSLKCTDCGNLNKYNPGPTSKPLDQTYKVTYGSGAGRSVEGSIYLDTVSIQQGDSSAGFKPVPGFPFIAAESSLKGQTKDGIVGLSTQWIKQGGSPATYPLLIPSLLGNNPTAASNFAFSPIAAGGATLTIGGAPMSPDGLVNLPVPNGPYWEVGLNSVQLAGADTNFVTTNKVWFDSGSVNIAVPQAELATLIDAIEKATGVTLVSTPSGLYFLPIQGLAKFPDLTFEFSGAPGKKFTVNRNLMVRTDKTGPGGFLINLVVGPATNWVFGLPFLKSVNSQFNIGQPPQEGSNVLTGYSVSLKPL